MKRFGFSTEEIDDSVVVADPIESLPVEEVVADNELHEEADSIAEDIQAMEDAEEAIPQIEEQAEFVDQAVTDGDGLTQREADIVVKTVEHICDRLGVSGLRLRSNATEAFASPSSRVSASTMTAEGIWDKAVDLWERFRKYVAGIWARLKKWVAGLFDAQKRNEDRQTDLLKQVGKLTKSAKKIEYNATPYVKALTEDPVKCLEAHVKLTEASIKFITATEAASKKLGNVVDKLLEDDKEADETVIKSEMDGLKTAFVGAGNSTSGSYSFFPLYGGREFTFTLNAAGGEEGYVLRAALQEERSNSKAIADGNKYTATSVYDISDLKAILGKTGEVLKVNAELTKNDKFDHFSKIIDSSIAACVDTIKNGKNKKAKEASQGTKTSLNKLRGVFSGINSSIAKVTSSVPSLNLKASTTAMNLVAENIKFYKSAK